MKKLKSLLKKISLFHLILILSPVIDLTISFIQRHFPGMSFVGTAIRGLFLFGLLIYTFFIKKENNKKILKYIIITFFVMLLCFIQQGINVLEIKNIFKFFFFPVVLACFFTCKIDILKIKNSLYWSAIIYAVLLFIPLITGTAINTYEYVKSGFVGWFYSPNEISVIVSMLLPFVILKIFEASSIKQKVFPFVFSLLYIYSIFCIGTKVPVLSVLGTLVVFLLIMIMRFFSKKSIRVTTLKNIITIIILLIFSIFCFKNGLGFNNVSMHNSSYESSDVGKNNDINKTPEEVPEIPEIIIKDDNSEMNSMEIIDNTNSNLLDKYFLEFSNEKNDYRTSKIINMILSSRDIYFMRKLTAWKESNFMSKMFGLGQTFSYNGTLTTKLVEIDFIDIFLNFGIIGLIIYFVLPIVILTKIIFYVLKNFKLVINNDIICAYLVSMFLAMGISLLAGHVFGAPSVSLILSIIMIAIYNDKFTTKIEKYSFKQLLKFIIFGSIVSLLIVGVYYVTEQNKHNTIDLAYDGKNLITLSKDNTIELKEEKNINSDYAKDNLKYYNIKKKNKGILKVIMVTRTFDNGIVFKYLTGQNITEDTSRINIKNNNIIKEITTFKDKEIIKGFSSTIGYDKRTLPSVYAQGKDYYSIGYKTYIYEIKKAKYDEENYSILKSLIKENDSTNQEGSNLTNSFELKPNELFDNLIIESENKLFSNMDELNSYIELINKGKSSSWLSFDGSYGKLPYSIEPFTKEGYGRNLGTTIEKDMFNLYKKTNNPLFESYVLSSLHILKNYFVRNEYGIWLTEYTSTWLKKDYGIEALYVDTRHNDTLSGYFNMLSEYYDYDDLKKWGQYYAKYLLFEYSNKNVNFLDYGILAPDYYSTHHNINTHSSLNHQLAIINYLLTTYKKTNNKDYKTLALIYLETIENIGEKWIKPNNDLHYQVNTNGEFEGPDYITLTLEDMLVTQDLLESIGKKKSKTLDKLIEAKCSYLESINYNFGDYLKKQLKEGGYDA